MATPSGEKEWGNIDLVNLPPGSQELLLHQSARVAGERAGLPPRGQRWLLGSAGSKGVLRTG